MEQVNVKTKKSRKIRVDFQKAPQGYVFPQQHQQPNPLNPAAASQPQGYHYWQFEHPDAPGWHDIEKKNSIQIERDYQNLVSNPNAPSTTSYKYERWSYVLDLKSMQQVNQKTKKVGRIFMFFLENFGDLEQIFWDDFGKILEKIGVGKI